MLTRSVSTKMNPTKKKGRNRNRSRRKRKIKSVPTVENLAIQVTSAGHSIKTRRVILQIGKKIKTITLHLMVTSKLKRRHLQLSGSSRRCARASRRRSQ
jgi:hypothetical protein